VDVYEPGPGTQLHDVNPSTFPPTGLFWTIAIPGEGIRVNPGKGAASMVADDVPILDFGNIPNALFDGHHPDPTPGSASFKVIWSGVEEQVKIRNDDPVYGGFAGTFIRNTAQMEWTATVGDFTFVSDALATSASAFAEIGQERNGIFFPS
jgi:hypothetical protein